MLTIPPPLIGAMLRRFRCVHIFLQTVHSRPIQSGPVVLSILLILIILILVIPSYLILYSYLPPPPPSPIYLLVCVYNIVSAFVFHGFKEKSERTYRPSEHPPVMGGKMPKRLGGIKGCKYKTSWHLWVNSIMSGRSPPLYCTFTLIVMQGHQKNIKNKPETM